ncbi:MAG: hypothetical protein WCJ26_01170 [bacterium]
MKKVLIVSLLALFLFNSIGYYLLFELNRYGIRHEMQALIKHNPSKLAVISVPDIIRDHSFQRIDKKEFRYKGVMYDIVREIKTSRGLIFICIHDAKESNLYSGLNHVNQNNLLIFLADHLVMISLAVPAVDMVPCLSGKLIFSRVNIPCISSLLPTWSPPPELG